MSMIGVCAVVTSGANQTESYALLCLLYLYEFRHHISFELFLCRHTASIINKNKNKAHIKVY